MAMYWIYPISRCIKIHQLVQMLLGQKGQMCKESVLIKKKEKLKKDLSVPEEFASNLVFRQCCQIHGTGLQQLFLFTRIYLGNSLLSMTDTRALGCHSPDVPNVLESSEYN